MGCKLSTSSSRCLHFYNSGEEAVKEIPHGAKLLVGGQLMSSSYMQLAYPVAAWLLTNLKHQNTCKFLNFQATFFSADITPEMLKLCRFTKMKVFFLVLAYIFNFYYLILTYSI